MTSKRSPSTLSRWGWGIALVSLPLFSAGTIFGLPNEAMVKGENSALAQLYTDTSHDLATPASDGTVSIPDRFGRSTGTATLVLYDSSGAAPEDAEMYGIATANLATHFGEVKVSPVSDYSADSMFDFDAVIYIGTDDSAILPADFVDDVRAGTVPVMWVAQNITDLMGETPAATDGFINQYGWDPRRPRIVASDQVQSIHYKERRVQRNTESAERILSPRIISPVDVKVLVRADCGTSSLPSVCGDIHSAKPQELPWVIRSGNLTYLAEIPLNYITENDLYLVFADLYYDLLAPDTAPLRQAAVRLEDVGPEADPADLRAIADYLQQAGIPFQVAVVPIHVARTPDEEGWYGLSLLDTPEVIDALKYMQERGGTLIQHGTTHQYGAVNNPYSGRSGQDYEFYRYGCSRTSKWPYAFETCQQDSYVRKLGPVAENGVEQHLVRMKHGRQIMVDAGLGEPRIFETPHYTASVNAYVAMSRLYDARYEQTDYYAGILSQRKVTPEHHYSQYFPYTVHDIYGITVYPETLQNITETELNHHPVRSPQTLIDRAEAHLVVRESTASFFFHPYLDLDYLEETVQGLKDLGYTFVSVEQLK